MQPCGEIDTNEQLDEWSERCTGCQWNQGTESEGVCKEDE